MFPGLFPPLTAGERQRRHECAARPWPAGIFSTLQGCLRRRMDEYTVQNVSSSGQESGPPRFLTQALDCIEHSAVIVDADHPGHPIVYCNPAFERLTGYSRHQVLGRNGRFLQYGDDDTGTRARLRDCLADGRPFRGVLKNVRADGSVFWNDLSVVAAEFGDGRYLLGMQKDVTERDTPAGDNGHALLDWVTGALSRLLHADGEQGVFTDLITHLVELTGSECGLIAHVCEGRPPRTLATGRYGPDCLASGCDSAVLPPCLRQLLLDGGENAPVPADGLCCEAGTVGARRLIHVPLMHAGRQVGLLGLVTRHDGDELLVRERLRPVTAACAALIAVWCHDERLQRAERSLAVNEARYRAMVSALSEGLLLVDGGGRVLVGNQAAERILGQPGLAAGGMLLNDRRWRMVDEQGRALAPDDYPTERVLRGGQAVRNVVIGVLRDDGQPPCWVRTHVEPLHVEGATSVALIVSFVDITELKQREHELAEQDARWKAVFAATGDMVFDLTFPSGDAWRAALRSPDGDGLLTLALPGAYFSPSWLGMVGLDTMPADSYRDRGARVHPEDVAHVAHELGRHLRGETALYFAEYRLLRADGGVLPVLDRGQVYQRDEDGLPLRMHGVMIDLSPQKQAEETARRFRKVVEATSDGMAFIDRNDRIELANRTMRDWLGTDGAAVLGRPFSERARVMGLTLDLAAARVRCQGGGSVRERCWVNHGGRGPRHVEISLEPYRDTLGRFDGMVCMLRDITDSERQAQLMAQTQHAARIGGWQLDPETLTLFWTPQTYRLLGLVSAEEKVELSVALDFMTAESRERVMSRLAELLRGESSGKSIDIQVLTAQGELRTLELISHRHDLAAGAIQLIGSVQDVTDERAAERELALSAQVFEHGREAVFITDPQGEIVRVNAAFCAITGYAAGQACGQPMTYRWQGAPALLTAQAAALAQSGHWQGEVSGRRANGEVHPEWCSIASARDAGGRISHYIGMFVDISDLKAAEARALRLANYDHLTDLPSRPLLYERLNAALAQADRDGSLVGVLFCDLDRFKNINDTLGHSYGDGLLRVIAQRFSRQTRSSDVVCRYGGDEFVVVLTGMHSVNDLARLADQLRASVSAPVHVGDTDLMVTTSLGIAVYPHDGRDIDTLLRHADAALYHAKALGRNNYQFFTRAINERISEYLVIENGLRRALDRQEFELHYQPQIDMRSGKLIGVEALLRWKHPEQGLISPARFIPIAEETGLIVPIGDWVIHTACQAARAWQEDGLPPITFAVNLSARQFTAHVVDTIDRALALTGLAPCWLQVEATESVLMEDLRETEAVLSELKARGLSLSIDDFGTGYSSLAYLKRFPLDQIKIDRSFVQDIGVDDDNALIVNAIIGLGHSLGVQVLAEGVETESQWQFLRGQGCDEVQGFLISRPLPIMELAETVRHDGFRSEV